MGRSLWARALALDYNRHPRKRRGSLMLGVWSGETNVSTTGGVGGLGSQSPPSSKRGSHRYTACQKNGSLPEQSWSTELPGSAIVFSSFLERTETAFHELGHSEIRSTVTRNGERQLLGARCSLIIFKGGFSHVELWIRRQSVR